MTVKEKLAVELAKALQGKLAKDLRAFMDAECYRDGFTVKEKLFRDLQKIFESKPDFRPLTSKEFLARIDPLIKSGRTLEAQRLILEQVQKERGKR